MFRRKMKLLFLGSIALFFACSEETPTGTVTDEPSSSCLYDCTDFSRMCDDLIPSEDRTDQGEKCSSDFWYARCPRTCGQCTPCIDDTIEDLQEQIDSLQEQILENNDAINSALENIPNLSCTQDSDCENGGTCEANGRDKECACTPEYTGPLCTTDVDECEEGTMICENGGTCVNKIGSCSCDCTAAYTGDTCDTDVDECTEGLLVCLNGGTCINDVGSASCQCTARWTGDVCSEDIDECTQGLLTCDATYGTCVNVDGSAYCTCSQGSLDVDGSTCNGVTSYTQTSSTCNEYTGVLTTNSERDCYGTYSYCSTQTLTSSTTSDGCWTRTSYSSYLSSGTGGYFSDQNNARLYGITFYQGSIVDGLDVRRDGYSDQHYGGYGGNTNDCAFTLSSGYAITSWRIWYTNFDNANTVERVEWYDNYGNTYCENGKGGGDLISAPSGCVIGGVFGFQTNNYIRQLEAWYYCGY